MCEAKMISDEIQKQIIQALQTAKAEGGLCMTTSQIAQRLGTYRGRIMANASLLKERKILNNQKIANAMFWYLAEE